MREVSSMPFGESDAKKRVKNVLNYKKPIFWAIIIAVVIVVGISILLLTNPKQNETAVSLLLKQNQFYAYVEVPNSTSPILLVTDATYDYEDIKAGIWCDVYATWDGKTQKIGHIESTGTVYPICYDQKGIYSAGGHIVARYVVDNVKKQLVETEYANETFDTNGDVTYTYYNQKNGEQVVKDSTYLDDMVEKYGNATVVSFLSSKNYKY